MGTSKRYVVASFFLTLTMASICQSVCAIWNGAYSGVRLLVYLCYVGSFFLFLIKYFIDDTVDDNTVNDGQYTRHSLSSLIIGWVLFLLSALSLNRLAVSSLLWFTGLISITHFMWRTRRCIDMFHFKRYLGENIFMMLMLGSSSGLSFFGGDEAGLSLRNWMTVLSVVFVFLLFIFSICMFVRLLADDRVTIVTKQRS